MAAEGVAGVGALGRIAQVIAVPKEFELERDREWVQEILDLGPRSEPVKAGGKLCQACSEVGVYEDVDGQTAGHVEFADFLAFSTGHEWCRIIPSRVQHRPWRFCEVCRRQVRATPDRRCGLAWLCEGCRERTAAAGLESEAVLADLAIRRYAFHGRLHRVPAAEDPVDDDPSWLDLPPVPPPEGWLPLGLDECPECGTIRGATRTATEEGEVVVLKSTCLCEGLRCKRCERQRIRRPITDYFDTASGSWWHVPYFAAMGGLCSECREAHGARS